MCNRVSAEPLILATQPSVTLRDCTRTIYARMRDPHGCGLACCLPYAESEQAFASTVPHQLKGIYAAAANCQADRMVRQARR